MENKNTKSAIAFLYVVTMTLAFTTRYGDVELNYELQLIIGLFWIAMGLSQLALNKFRFRGKIGNELPGFIKLYILPHLVIHCYTIFLMAIGKVSWSYFTTNLTVYVPTILAIMAVYLMQLNAYKYTCIALFGSWVLSVFISLATKGPAIFVHAVIQAYVDPLDSTGGLTSNYLELHDLVLAIGYIIVFYIFSNAKHTKRQLGVLTFVFIIMILGMKRVSILGLILAGVFYIVLKRLRPNWQYKVCLLSGAIVFILCYLFIYILSDGSAFYDIIEKLGINVMGRNYYYKAIMSYATFKPSFMGIGRNVITKLLNSELSYLRVGGVHSDIIKMYVENGFVLFGGWLWYYLIHITQYYKKNYGVKSAVLYFGVVIYMFTLYLTDNIEVYFICQLFSTIIPITFALKEENNVTNKEHCK